MGTFCGVDGKVEYFNYAVLRNASCPVIIKYLTFYLFIWLAELAFLAFLVGLYCCFAFCVCVFLACATFFFFLKETRPPWRRSPPSRRQTSRDQPPRAQLALGSIRISANPELVRIFQESEAPHFPEHRWLYRLQRDPTRSRSGLQKEWPWLWCGPWVCVEGRFLHSPAIGAFLKQYGAWVMCLALSHKLALWHSTLTLGWGTSDFIYFSDEENDIQREASFAQGHTVRKSQTDELLQAFDA